MDPNQDKPEGQPQGQEPRPKSEIPETPPSSNSYWDNLNKTQTPAYNNTEYWNPKGSETKPTPPSEPVNPPEPLSSTNAESPTSTPESSAPMSSEPTQAVSSTSQETTSSWNTPPAPPAKPKSSSNTLMVVMIVLVIVLLGGTGLFWFQNYQLKNQVKNKTANTYEANPTPESTPDPYADWKTYESKNVPFTFRYPSNMTLKDDGKKVSLVYNGPTQKLETEYYDAILLHFYYPVKLATNTTLKQYAQSKVNASKVNAKITKELAEVEINGIKGYSYTAEGLGNSKYIYLPVDDKVVEIIDSTVDPTGLGFAQTVSQIFSTFKLVTATPSTSPTATGTCEKGFKMFDAKDYSFCYPEDMKETSTSTTSVVVLDNATETLKVSTNFQGGWGGSPCLTIDPTKVAGLPSKRLSWKVERSDGTCDSTFKSFAEMINEGVFKFPYPYALELTSKKLPFENNSKFITIEQSFKVKN